MRFRHCLSQLFHARRSLSKASGRTTKPSRRLLLEPLEDRCVPATFTVVNALDSGTGSLRQAIIDANGTANVGGVPDEIHFNIPGGGVHTITPSTSLPFITDPVIIDGYTQAGASANTNGPSQGDNAVLQIEISGATVLTNGLGIVLLDQADGSTIRGLVIDQGFSRGIVVQASDVHIEGCFIGVDPTGTTAHGNGVGIFFDFGTDTSNGVVGGTTPDKRNVIAGNNPQIFIQSGTKHLIQGNLIGTDATGLVGLSAGGNGINIQSSNDNVIGGSTPAERNVINGSIGISVGGCTGTKIQGNFIQVLIDGVTKAPPNLNGVFVDTSASSTQIGGLTSTPGTGLGNVIAGHIAVQIGGSNNFVLGNLIGTDATGTKALGIDVDGVQLTGPSNTVGGPTADARNVISACGRAGITITSLGGLVTGNLIQGNFIGTDITGGPNSIGNIDGVFLEVAKDNQILGNVIAGNASRGVEVVFSSNNNAILGNSIFANGGLGIDLVGGTTDAFGATANDPGDEDTGPNNLQNFPIITSVNSGGGNTTITGTLNSTPNTQFRFEFFANDAADPSGFGEGQTFLGFTNVTTNVSGDASFNVTFANSGGSVISATATDPSGNTSEFSAVQGIPEAGPPDLQISVSDGVTSTTPGSTLTYTLNYANVGNQGATGVQLTETLPAGTTFNAGASTAGWIETAPGSGVFTLAVGNLAIGSSSAVFAVTVNSPTPAGQTQIINTASIADDATHGADPTPANNTSTDTDSINQLTTDLSVANVASPLTLHAGDNLTFTLTVRNLGSNPALNVILSDAVPAGATFVSLTAPLGWAVQAPAVGGTGTVSATLPSLAAGAVAVFQLVVHVNPGTVAGTIISNSAQVATTTTDTNPGNNSASATAQVVLQQVTTRMVFKLAGRYADYRSELGLFTVDDATGRIGNLHPGDRGYAQAALSRRQFFFNRLDPVGTSHTLDLPAGTFYGWYLVQNNTSARFLALNPSNRLSLNKPLMFFSFRAANPDATEHLRQISSSLIGFEDLTHGGDRDYNDLIVSLTSQDASVKAAKVAAKSAKFR